MLGIQSVDYWDWPA